MADLRITPPDTLTRAIAPIRFPELQAPGADKFRSALGQALAEVDALQQKAQEAATTIATGKAQDTAQSVAMIEKANISFQFALQVRNKLLEAYQEVMRMSV
jgi:flagellar hook-basal body complex protein FliE